MNNHKKKDMKGGLKPTQRGTDLNRSDPQDGLKKVLTFINEQQALGITYPPLITDSIVLHVPKPEFARESIEYPIIKAEENVIKIDTSERSIRPLTAEQSNPIDPNLGVHRHHEYHPYRVQVTIKRQTYFVKTIDENTAERHVITLFEDIPPEFLSEISSGDIATVSRNRQGDFVIYNPPPAVQAARLAAEAEGAPSESMIIRYLDNQLQRDYEKVKKIRVGHFSLLDKPSDYEAGNVRGDETDETRATDKILYAGSLIWREDGRALFYKNDCGRYQPDSADGDYLAKINSAFDKSKETATGDETEGAAKLFYRPHDQISGLDGVCSICSGRRNFNDLRIIPGEIDVPACRECYGELKCGVCAGCMAGLECKDNFDTAPPYKGPKVEVVPEWQRKNAALYKARLTKMEVREKFTPESELPFLNGDQIKHINKKLGHGKWLDDPFQNALKQARFDMGKGVIHKSTTLDVIDEWLEAALKIRSEKGQVTSDEAEDDDEEVDDDEDAFGGGRRKSKKRKRKKRTKRRKKNKSKKRKSKKRTRRRRR